MNDIQAVTLTPMGEAYVEWLEQRPADTPAPGIMETFSAGYKAAIADMQKRLEAERARSR